MKTGRLSLVVILVAILSPLSGAQQGVAPSSKPVDHLLGTVTSVSAVGETVTLKEDGSGLEHVIHLQNTRTLLKVSPGAKDLKAATRITPADLSTGDRIDVRGSKMDGNPTEIVARSVVLMSNRELQQAHQSEASAWQHSTVGTVTAVDLSEKKITVNLRSLEGPKPVVVVADSAVFTRYSPEHPKNPGPSQISDIQPGDQVKIIGDPVADSTAIAARKIYSGSFKTMAGTISSIAPDGKSLVVKDLGTKQTLTVVLTDDSSLHRLPPPMALILARRLNPDSRSAGTVPGESGGSGNPNGAAGAPPYGAKAGEASGEAAPGARPASDNGARGGRAASGDLSKLLERTPKITTADLKVGDAVIVSGSPSTLEERTLLATGVIAGVEPIFQSASAQQARSLGDWGSSLGAGAALDAGSTPQ